MQLSLLADRKITRETVRDMLSLVAEGITLDGMRHWTDTELLVACDWAAREHLRASDNTSVRRRPKPSFVTAAQVRHAAWQVALSDMEMDGR
jgi:hypothetical protein